MRGINLHFGSFAELCSELEARSEEHELSPGEGADLREGEWLLATLHVGEEAIAVAGRVLDRGTGLCLTFEDRDWQRVCAFAEGHRLHGFDCDGQPCRPSAPPSSRRCEPRLSAPPGSSALIVDDDAHVRTVVCTLLRGAGCETNGVDSAEEAVVVLGQHKPDVLVLDWNLPGMSGVELCLRLRQDRAYRQMPVLFLTAHSSTDDLVAAFKAGADDFVSKPFRVPELGARVLGLLRRARWTLATP